ncbi:MAG: EAL domain-containing protein [Burkholderiales bacterium]|nr:EAL domain-containing protein [Burkholderiales bacterium]
MHPKFADSPPLSSSTDEALATSLIPAREYADRERILDAMGGLVCEFEMPTFRLVHLSKGVEALLGYRRDWWLGQSGFCRQIIVDTDWRLLLRACAGTLRTGRDHHLELRMRGADGEIVWLRGLVQRVTGDPHASLLRAVVRDVSETRNAEARADAMSSRDGVTGLPNRRALRELLLQQVGESRRRHERLALLHLDLDRFKLVNETLGYEIGDQLLIAVGGRIRGALREGDVVARIGDDEFAVVLGDVQGPETAARVANQLLEVIAEAHLGDDVEGTRCSGSIGISLFPDDTVDADQILIYAEMATQTVKANGGRDYRFYTPRMNSSALERLNLVRHLDQALSRDELELHYQPQFDVSSGRLIGAEALLRWQHPELGCVPPHQFVPLAEETGDIVAIGRWVIDQACRQIAAWDAAGVTVPRVAINVSVAQFQHDVHEDVLTALERHGVRPDRLEIEITETLLMQDFAGALQSIEPLAARGVTFAIDDFGTGYSSLSMLNRLPVQAVKLDRSFVTGLSRDDGVSVPIVTAVIAMAHSLGLTVVAEGVETDDQLSTLDRLGCDEFQGFLRSRAVTATAFVRTFFTENPHVDIASLPHRSERVPQPRIAIGARHGT